MEVGGVAYLIRLCSKWPDGNVAPIGSAKNCAAFREAFCGTKK